MQDLCLRESRANGRWTREEHLKFLEGLRIFGKNWKKIQQLVQTRTGSQIRSHAQKFFLKLKEPAQANLTEHSQSSPEHQPDPEEHLNSKMASETAPQEDDFSYFLMKIVDYASNKHCLNFWSDLIDFKEATQHPQKTEKYRSFLTIGGDYTLPTPQNLARK